MARPARIAELILHPLVLLALVVWIVNDHWAKAAFSNAWTGKISDVASLIVFPLLPICALAHWREARGQEVGRWWVFGWLAATGMVMATINVLDPAARAYEVGLAIVQWPFRAALSLTSSGELPLLAPVDLTMDPTDLWTLPALLVPWLLIRTARSASESKRPAIAI